MTVDLAEARAAIKADWAQSPYYDMVEAPDDPAYWGEHSIYKRLFDQLDLTNVIELACGHGRHAARIVDRVGHITLADINASNIEFCRQRFAGKSNVRFLTCSGSDLAELESASYTALFCYDAMVHFEIHDIISYLDDFRRIFRPQGRAVLHFSNYTEHPGRMYRDNPHWRNFCGEVLFRHLAMRAGFSILESQLINWGGVDRLDGLVLIERA
jgi:ubiquinone/menaquinone biosynthesis C-methylase UbiE